MSARDERRGERMTQGLFSRRTMLWAGLGGAAALPLTGLTAGRASAETVATVNGVKTAADVAKAEKEGQVLYYTHDGEAGAAVMVDAFTKTFPKIKATYFRAQTGALYSKLLAERSAGRYVADIVQFSDIATTLDFKKRGGYQNYVSPQDSAYAPRDLSSPPGDYFLVGITFGGIGYNTNLVPADEAPKTWKDLLDPRWRNALSTKQATSGMQFVEWYELQKLYGPEFWTKFGKQRPRGFDSRVQLFDRLAKGDDKVCALAEYAGYLLYKQKGAPIAFVAPPDGLPATPAIAGIASRAPHPEAAKLFMDWLMSPLGQTVYQENPQLYYASLRNDAPPLPGGKRLSDFKLLNPIDDPAELKKYLASQKEFTDQWNKILGLL